MRRCLLLLLLASIPTACSKKDDDPKNQPPSLSNGTASPDPVARGASVLLTVDASDPDGTVASVSGDLTALGGLADQAFYDDGTNGDAAPADGTWSLRAAVQTTSTPGPASIPVTAVDDLGASGEGAVSLTIKTNLVPVLTNPRAVPSSAKSGITVLFMVDVTDDGTVTSVVLDLSSMGGSASQAMFDDGTSGDVLSGDGTWSFANTIPGGEALGGRVLDLLATDDQADSASSQIAFTVIANQPPVVSNESASPDPPVQGGSVLLTADASDPDGTVTTVTVDLSSMNGPAGQGLYDDGTNGDLTPSDWTWSYGFAIPLAASTGAKSLPVTATDDEAATGTGAIAFTLAPNPGPSLSAAAASPDQATGEDTVTFTVQASDPQGVAFVNADLSALGGSASQAMLDDGNVPPGSGDATASDGTYTCWITLSAHVAPGNLALPVTAQDGQGAPSNSTLPLQVLRLRLEMTNFMYGLSAGTGTDLVVGGEQGFVYHGDSVSWRMVNTKNANTSKRQNGAFVLATGEAFTVGQTASSSYFNGSAWSYHAISTSGGTNEFYDVWALSPSLAFAVGTSLSGTQPNLHRWTGASWSAETSGTTQTLKAIWGSSAPDVVAVGLNNTVRHWDGVAWNGETVTATFNDLFGVWGNSTGSTYYAVTADGGNIGLAPYNGEIWVGTLNATPPPLLTWAQLATVAGSDLYDIHGTAVNDLWMVGSAGTILHSTDGTTFNPVASPTNDTLYTVWAVASNDVWAAGANGTILHYDGISWSVAVRPSTYPNDCWGMTVPTATDAWRVDVGGDILQYNAGNWIPEYTHGSPLRGAWAPAGSAADVFAVGDIGNVLHRTGASWGMMAPQPPVTAGTLYVVWGRTATDFFVGGRNASANGAGVWRYAGSPAVWSAIHTGFTGGVAERIYGLGGDPAGSVEYACSNMGRLYQLQSPGAWSDITANLGAGPFSGFNGIWSSGPTDTYLVGNNGQAFHYNGAWAPVGLPGTPTVDLLDVCGTSASDVYIIGRNMTVFRYNGSTWKVLPFQCTADLLEGGAYGNLVLFAGEDGQATRLEK